MHAVFSSAPLSVCSFFCLSVCPKIFLPATAPNVKSDFFWGFGAKMAQIGFSSFIENQHVKYFWYFLWSYSYINSYSWPNLF